MTSESYHEPVELLSQQTKDMHRAIVSLMEELEAVDWYQQRAEACGDPELRDILLHNRDEEIEHAMMVLEWLRRRHPKFGSEAKTYLFTDVPITEIEEVEEVAEGGLGESRPAAGQGSLGIGSLRRSTVAEGGARWTS